MKYETPSYDEIVDRYQLKSLISGWDLSVESFNTGKLDKRGDFQMNDQCQTELIRLINQWRWNYVSLRTNFDNVFDTNNIPLPFIDVFLPGGDINQITDKNGELTAVRASNSGTIMLVIYKILQTFTYEINIYEDEWKRCNPIFTNSSLGQILEASANNFRHNEEWVVTHPPNDRQLKSLKILSDILNEPLNDKRHNLSRDISPETLEIISKKDFDTLEKHVFEFVKNLLKMKNQQIGHRTKGQK